MLPHVTQTAWGGGPSRPIGVNLRKHDHLFRLGRSGF